MSEQYDQHLAELREKLATLQEQVRALGTTQANSRTGPPTPQAGGRSSGRVRLVLLSVVALFAVGFVLHGHVAQSAADALALFINPNGWVGIGTQDPNATLDVKGTLKVSEKADISNTTINNGDPKGLALKVTGKTDLSNTTISSGDPNALALKVAGKTDLSDTTISSSGDGTSNYALKVTSPSSFVNVDVGKLFFGTTRGQLLNLWSDEYGVGIQDYTEYFRTGYDFAWYRNGAHSDSRTDPGGGKVLMVLKENGVVQAADFAATATNPMRSRMYPAGPIVFEEIFTALRVKAIQKLGNPSYNDNEYRQNLWYDRHIILFGGNNEPDGNGAVVTIPPGYNTVWVRVLGERWNAIHVYFLNGNNINVEDLGVWTGGRRSANSYAPDGTLTDGYDVQHQWVPIAAGHAGSLALISKQNTNADFWVSGLAFSNNPWAHAAQSAVGYHWAVNGGNQTGWQSDDFGADVLGKIDAKTNLELRVPVVPSGRDKLLYLIEHNSNWNGAMHTAITVQGQQVERFMDTYDNPFSRHWDSKNMERYIATRIPNALIPKDTRYIIVRIDMSKQNKEIFFREIGTHDLDVPWP